MLINPDNLRHWLNHFYGYGTWNAPVWFVSYEDGGGDLPEDVAEKLHYFAGTHPHAAEPTLCDIRELYNHTALRIAGPKGETYKTLFDYRFGSQALLNGVWKNLIAFTYAYRELPQPELLTYQKNSFATKNEALIKLYPLPAPHNHAWYYAWLDMPQFPFLKRRESYESYLYPDRVQQIIGNMLQHKPKLVLMYGMNNINALKESVRQLVPSVTFKMIKAEKLKIPQHHRAEIGGTTLVITTQIPALRHGRKETGFEWAAFGKELRTKA